MSVLPPTFPAAVVASYGAAPVVENVTFDELRPDEVLVKVVSSGICHTDEVARAGDYPVPTPIVLGHEGAGVVVAVGDDVTYVATGDHVVMSFVWCGECSTCRAGRIALCQRAFEVNFLAVRPDGSCTLRREDGTALHGRFFGQSSHAAYAVCPESCLVKIPRGFDLTLAGPLGCGVQTGAGAVLNSLQPARGSSIAVFGVGAVGLSAIMAAKLSGCAVIVAVDRHPSRLELARELGATHVLLAAGDDDVVKLRDISDGGLEYAIDTTGNPVVVRTAVDALRVAGVFGLIGAAKFGTEVSLDLTHMLFGRIFRGIIEGDSVPREFIPTLIEHYLAGRFPVDRLYEYFTLDQLSEAVQASETGQCVKPVILFPE
jgi:aryl-alcohol dehydrogenase